MHSSPVGGSGPSSSTPAAASPCARSLTATSRPTVDAVAGEPPAGDAVRGRLGAQRPVGAVGERERQAQHGQPRVAERAQVLRRRRGRRALVDRHERVALELRAALDDHRQPPPQHGLDERVPVGQRDRARTRRPRRRARAPRRPRRRSPGTRCSATPAPASPRRNSTVAGSSNAYDSASPSTTPSTPVLPRRSERASAFGPGVAELVGLGQDPLAQLGRQLLRPVVGVGHRHRRDAERLRDGGQRHPRQTSDHVGQSASRASYGYPRAHRGVPRPARVDRGAAGAGRSRSRARARRRAA